MEKPEKIFHRKWGWNSRKMSVQLFHCWAANGGGSNFLLSAAVALKENWCRPRLPCDVRCTYRNNIYRAVPHGYECYCDSMWRSFIFITKDRSSASPSFVQSTRSSGGWAAAGQVTTPSSPVGRYVSSGIGRARAGSEWRERREITYFEINILQTCSTASDPWLLNSF